MFTESQLLIRENITINPMESRTIIDFFSVGSERHEPALLPQTDDHKSHSNLRPVKKAKRHIAFGLVAVIFLLVASFVLIKVLTVTDASAIEDHFIVQLNKQQYVNESLVQQFVQHMTLTASTSRGDFVLLHEYSHLGSESVIRMSVKMSDSMRQVMQATKGVEGIEPDLRVHISTTPRRMGALPTILSPVSITSGGGGDDDECQVQSNPKWSETHLTLMLLLYANFIK
jgi:hypothetical protein